MVPPAYIYIRPILFPAAIAAFCIFIYDYISQGYCIIWAVLNEAFESDEHCTKWRKP